MRASPAITAQTRVASRTMTDVVLPCLNEAAALPWVLSRIPAGYRAIVADNGSTDGSAEVAAAHGAAVVHVPQRGFGAAAHAGLLAATADVVCFLDADGSFDPVQLARVVDPVRAGTADLVLGRLANALLAWQLRRGVGYRCTTWGRCALPGVATCSPLTCATGASATPS